MKILVTGGTGFLGRHVVWRLAGVGHQLVFTGRDSAAAARVMAGNDARFVRVEHGASDAAAIVNRAATGAGAIIHCAALASPWGARAAFVRANIDATGEVLVAREQQGVAQLVHISSPSVYFAFRDMLDIAEDDPLPTPVNQYARTKRIAEQLVLGAPAPAVILRPRAIFGAWDNALLPRLIRLLRYGRVPLLRGGRALLDLTYVDNVVDAIELALALAPAGTGKHVFNITNGEPIEAGVLFARIADGFGLAVRPVRRPYLIADLAARGLELAAHLRPGWEPPFTRYSLGAIAFSQTLDLRRARTVLGYQARVSLADGIARTAHWWRTQ